jgi:hypothetical protein
MILLSSLLLIVAFGATVVRLPGIAGIRGVASISEVPFKFNVASGPAVIGFLAVDGVLAVASIPAHPGIPILAGGFTIWTIQCDITIKPSDYGYRSVILYCYRTIGISNITLANSRNYPTI